MNDCRTCKDRMVEAAYGELGPIDQEAFDRHARACPECSSDYSRLRATLSLLDKRQRPDPGPEFWAGYWDRLSRRMLWEKVDEPQSWPLWKRIRRSFGRLPSWAYQAAGAAALLVLGILIGSRLITPPAGKRDAGTASVALPSGTVVEAENFIERSKILLLGLVNSDPASEDAYTLDLGHKKALSRDLAASAPAIRGALNQRGQKRLRELVTDLEVILMQIANLGSGQDVEGVELVKQGIDQKGIFLKIDLERLGRDARGGTGPASPSGDKGLPLKKKI